VLAKSRRHNLFAVLTISVMNAQLDSFLEVVDRIMTSMTFVEPRAEAREPERREEVREERREERREEVREERREEERRENREERRREN
jgi:hypothetical protein